MGLDRPVNWNYLRHAYIRRHDFRDIDGDQCDGKQQPRDARPDDQRERLGLSACFRRAARPPS